MVLFGSQHQTYLSHIIMAEPHNYNVVAEVTLDLKTRMLFLNQKKQYPNDQFVLLLDPMDISKIKDAPRVSGTLFRVDAAGNKTPLASGVRITKKNLQVVHFQGLPLSLAGDR